MSGVYLDEIAVEAIKEPSNRRYLKAVWDDFKERANNDSDFDNNKNAFVFRRENPKREKGKIRRKFKTQSDLYVCMYIINDIPIISPQTWGKNIKETRK